MWDKYDEILNVLQRVVKVESKRYDEEIPSQELNDLEQYGRRQNLEFHGLTQTAQGSLLDIKWMTLRENANCHGSHNRILTQSTGSRVNLIKRRLCCCGLRQGWLETQGSRNDVSREAWVQTLISTRRGRRETKSCSGLPIRKPRRKMTNLKSIRTATLSFGKSRVIASSRSVMSRSCPKSADQAKLNKVQTLSCSFVMEYYNANSFKKLVRGLHYNRESCFIFH